jgi:hypothetical protein
LLAIVAVALVASCLSVGLFALLEFVIGVGGEAA